MFVDVRVWCVAVVSSRPQIAASVDVRVVCVAVVDVCVWCVAWFQQDDNLQ